MNTEQYLLYLLKTFINREEEVLPPPAGVSLRELYESGQKHNVAAMLYGVLRQAGLMQTGCFWRRDMRRSRWEAAPGFISRPGLRWNSIRS